MSELTADVDDVLKRHEDEYYVNTVIGDSGDVVYIPDALVDIAFLTRAELAAYFIGIEAAVDAGDRESVDEVNVNIQGVGDE